MLKLFIGHNFFGAGNFGDDLMLEGFLGSLAKSGKQAEIFGCIPHDVESQRRRFPRIHWISAADTQHREEQLREADVWLGLGDTPFQLASGPWMLDHLDGDRELCRRLGKPMLFLGVGCESRDAVRDPRGRRIIEAAERIWTRDLRSAEVIDEVAAPGVVAQGADLAHIALRGAVKPVSEPGLLGLLLGMENPETAALVAVQNAIARRSPAKTRWLIQETRSFPCTERWNYCGLSESARSLVDLMPMNYSVDTIDEFLRSFGAPETVVSSRYHGALIAAWHGCHLGVIARTEKLDGAAADLAVPYVRCIQEADELEGLANRAASVDQARLHVLSDRASGMCDAFFACFGA